MNLIGRLLKTAFPESSWDVDLHGMGVEEALATVEEALRAAKAAGGGRVRLICGKGKRSPGGVGVLREAVGGWLAKNGYDGEFTRRMEGDGLDGSIMVEVRGGPDHSAS